MGVYTTEWEHSVDCPSPKRHTQQIVSAAEECYRHEDCPAGRFGVRAELHAAADLCRAHTLVQTRTVGHDITSASLPHQHLASTVGGREIIGNGTPRLYGEHVLLRGTAGVQK